MQCVQRRKKRRSSITLFLALFFVGTVNSSRMMFTVTVFALVLTITGCQCLEFGGPADNAVVYTCSGRDLHLPWDYNKTSPTEEVTLIEWYFHGRSEEMVAMETHGHFLSEAAYSHRVEFVEKAGLTVRHVTAGDTGNYSVVISGHNPKGISFTHRRMIVVQVITQGQLLTTDGNLYASVKDDAMHNNVTGKTSLVLACGTFTYIGAPPFAVEWTLPSGAVVNSSEYKNGEFLLHVQSGGNYTCTVPAHADAACLGHQSPELQASVYVDPVMARLTLLEHDVHRLQSDNDLLKTKNTLLEQRFQNHEDHSPYVHPIAFHASLVEDDVTGQLIFKDVMTNIGNAYDKATGLFTVPRNGLYYIALTSRPIRHGYPDAYVKKGTSVICGANNWAADSSPSCHAVVRLVAGEILHAETPHHLCCTYTTFSGFLITYDQHP